MLYSSRFVFIPFIPSSYRKSGFKLATVELINIYQRLKISSPFREKMGRDGDGECKDFAKGVCFRGARFAQSSQTNILPLFFSQLQVSACWGQTGSRHCPILQGLSERSVSHPSKVVRRANPIITGVAITSRTTGEAVRLCMHLVLLLKSTIGQVRHLIDSISKKTCGAS